MSAAVIPIEKPSRDALIKAYRDAITNHIRAHTDGTNVNKQTLLTTDYLNHFNEVVMMLELVPAAPAEMAADLANWQHQTYEEHFEESGFRDKSLAIAAYRNAPEPIRHDFDMAIADLEQETVLCLRDVQMKMDAGDQEGLVNLCSDTVPRLQDMIGNVAGIINGNASEAPEEETPREDCDQGGLEQDKIDALFD